MLNLKNQPNETPLSVYNPQKEDFIFQWNGQDKILHAGEIETYPTWLANHAIKHLAEKILSTRGIKTNYEADLAKIREEITVNL